VTGLVPSGAMVASIEMAASTDIVWGEPFDGVRFGIRPPPGEVEAGATLALTLVCENRGGGAIWVFGFRAGYPRSLRVSPPKPDRPYIRISFADTNVLHPPDAFLRLSPGESAVTTLDLSFAFDRRGAGAWPVAFAYDTMRAAAGLRALKPPAGMLAQTGIATMVITRSRSLREAGIDETVEAELDATLLAGDSSAVDRLRQLGAGGATYLARRFARVLVPGADAVLGWRALDALELLGEEGLAAIRAARADLPHAEAALDFATEWLAHRLGHDVSVVHLPFVTMLDEIVHQPDRRGNFVLTWSPYDSPVHGSMTVELFGNGDRIVVVRPEGHAVPSTRRTQMGTMPMQTLFEALSYSGVWLLRPVRTIGLPDEPKPTLELQLALGEQYTRKIAMWNGEWRHGPAQRLVALLDRLGTAVAPASR
jgi:hypothetical protein